MTQHFSLKPLQKSFGALITDIRLADINDSAFSEIYAAWLEYALLIFPGQYLSDDEQAAFARRFGNLVEGLDRSIVCAPLPSAQPEKDWRTNQSQQQ
jgi:alpha-ketoglutarate-dependent taurine dioxygenase